MMFPIESLIAENRELGLVVAVLLGFCFGFVLERAGFGRATKLAAQFYFYEMTVFKVMFSAILTAMLGLVLASGMGLTDLKIISETAASETFIWPMLVGGLLLGAGFIISGFCPGTSIVASASGSIDGFVAFAGVICGSLLFSEAFPLLQDFYTSGAKGQLFLYNLLGIPPYLLAAFVTLMAIGAFMGAEKLERIFTVKIKNLDEPASVLLPPRRLAFGILSAVAVLSVLISLLPGAPPRAAAEKVVITIDQTTLAHRILEQPWSLRILDVRDRQLCEKNRIPGSECVPLENLDQIGLAYSAGKKDLVLVAEKTITSVPAAAIAYPGSLLLLEDGFAGWEAFALTAPDQPGADASPAELENYRFRSALNGAMTGRKPPPPPPADIKKYVPEPAKKKGRGCS